MQMNEQELRKLDAEVHAAMGNNKPQFGLMKCGLYYRPNACGYTSHESEAWKTSYEEVKEHEYVHGEPDDVTIVEFNSVPRYTSDKASAFEVLKWCAERCAVVTFKRIDGSWEAFKSGENCMFGVGPTLEIALCRFALELAGRGK